jgi:adenylate cyclase
MLKIRITGPHDTRAPFDQEGPVEFGRGPARGEVPRCVLNNPRVEYDHLRLEETPEGIRVTNLAPGQPFRLPSNALLAPGDAKVLPAPVPPLMLAGTVISVELVRPTDAPYRPSTIGSSSVRQTLSELGASPAPETLTDWLASVIADGLGSDGARSFHGEAARAAVDRVGLDHGRVFLLKDGAWDAAAGVDAPASAAPEPDLDMVRRAAASRDTHFNEVPRPGPRGMITAAVAAPVLGDDGRVVGVLYGSRSRPLGTPGAGIGRLEAQIVQLLATYLGARLAWEQADAKANRLRYQFERFFSPALADALERDDTLLEGRAHDVTVMMTDIRGFSTIAERLDPRDTCTLASELLDVVTSRIRDHDGVIIDYAGDGLMALWNAPFDQPDHADLACRSALAILAEVPRISATWARRVGGPVSLGLGINTGRVTVGNVGSRYRFKYGAIGHPVNLASRVEGATRHLGVPALITRATRDALRGDFPTRRIGKVRLAGMGDAVDLFELSVPDRPGWSTLRSAYEQALELFEVERLPEACRILQPLLAGRDETGYDVPSLDLISRAVQRLRSPLGPFDPVLVLGSK